MPTDPALRQARREADRLRGTAQIHTGLAVLWVALATLQWLTGDELWQQVTWTVLALAYAVATVLHRRQAYEAAARVEALQADGPV
ncbi:hypothetical protein [Geodermatophilus sp. DSM 44513]|uniref:hypothetical protein n=1 Tax=Geodermatophilus sp. DSM 44513 TaxID=1528104 RepID=UPI00126E26AF|nr:hypothetical protein [Geodermatophilus sp. DSM 44513]WNV77424.1 hypothetical protein RTG05_09130 [Geodermatophilus sp. DSM 44513]